jgi:hypothetical protein
LQLYSSFPGVPESIKAGKYICCLHFIANHQDRGTSPQDIRREPQRSTTFVTATRTQRNALLSSRRKVARAAVAVKRRGKRAKSLPAAPRLKSRRSLDVQTPDNPDIKSLIEQGIPSCLFPVNDTPSLGAFLKAINDRIELQRLEIEALKAKLDRERHPLTWTWVGERADLLETYTGLSRGEFARVQGRYVSGSSCSGRKADSMSDEDRVLPLLPFR